MKTLLIPILLVIAILGCETEIEQEEFTLEVNQDAYYPEEVISTEFLDIYGQWKLYDVTGGFSGNGHEIDFDYLVLKPFGIYGLINHNELIEYGKIEVVDGGLSSSETLQISMIPKFPAGSHYFSNTQANIQLSGIDTLHLVAPCCDMFNYHFKRIKKW